eukprot:2939512-Prorocentrum_lima.AAC.1
MDPSVVGMLNVESVAAQSYPQTVEELHERIRRKLIPPGYRLTERFEFGRLRQGNTDLAEFLTTFDSFAARLTGDL